MCKKVGDEVGNLLFGVIGLIVNDEYLDVIFVLFVFKV